MMDSQKFIALCKQVVADHANVNADASALITPDDVYISWSCKALQNNKALASTPLPDGMYYELTYNGDKKELYLDAYKKIENRVIPVNE